MDEQIKQELFNLSDEKYKRFHGSLCPNIDNILGVRVPILRNYAKELVKLYGKSIIEQIGNEYYEEIMLQGMCIGLCKMTLEETQMYLENWIPKIDNWAVCDVVVAGIKIIKEYQEKIWEFLQKYIKSDKEYEIRFGIVALIDFYITEEYIERVLNILGTTYHEGYYAKMAISWAISVCYIKFPSKTKLFLKSSNLDEFIYKKAIQKICDSYRVSQKEKDTIKGNF